MAQLLADIKLRWYDDSALIRDSPRELLDVFLDSIGVTSAVAGDLMEVLFMARARDVPLKAGEIMGGMAEVRRRRGAGSDYGMTYRNVLVWLKYFHRIGLIDCVDRKYRFSGNKTPSEAFKKTGEVVAESLKFSGKALDGAQKAYGIV
jgi:hypothetical protein